MKLVNVKASTKIQIYSNLKIAPRSDLKVGDVVRISKYKTLFAKVYTPSWTTELFKIRKVNFTFPVTFLLKDMQGNTVEGCFYREKILKTMYPDVYLVDKVLRRKGNKVYVQWTGLNQRSWTHKNDAMQ